MAKKIRRKKVFNGCLLKVYKSKRTLPNRREVNFEEIDHPGAALIVPFIKNKIILIRQYRAVIENYIWELPAGTLEPNETPYSCAKRELAEETGYGAKTLKKLGFIYTTPGFCTEKIHIYKAECGLKQKAQQDDGEVIRAKHLTIKEIQHLFKKGKITDSKTISALTLAGVL